MKVSLLQENLNKGIGIVGRTVASRVQLPILSNILLAAEPGKLKLTSTNLETVNLELDGDKLRLSCGQFKAIVNGISAAEYPDVPSLKGKTAKGEITLKKELIKEAVEQAAVAAGVDDSRPIFTGVKVEICPTGLRLAATAGYRLSVKTVNQFKASTIKKTLIVPARALLELARSLDFDSSDEFVLAPTDEEKH